MRISPTILRFSAALALIGLGAVVRGEEASPPASAPTSPGQPTPPNPSSLTNRRTIQQDGLTFVLSRSTRVDTVETEEYFLEKEAPEAWSQMLTYQRVILPEPLPTDQYVTWLKHHLEQLPNGPRLRIVQQGKGASIFGVHYPKSGNAGEQFGLALITVADSRRPNELHLIQYSINTDRVPLDEMELLVKRWQARLQSQAASLSH